MLKAISGAPSGLRVRWCVIVLKGMWILYCLLRLVSQPALPLEGQTLNLLFVTSAYQGMDKAGSYGGAIGLVIYLSLKPILKVLKTPNFSRTDLLLTVSITSAAKSCATDVYRNDYYLNPDVKKGCQLAPLFYFLWVSTCVLTRFQLTQRSRLEVVASFHVPESAFDAHWRSLVEDSA